MFHSCIRALAQRYGDRIDLILDPKVAPIGNLMPEVSTVYSPNFTPGRLCFLERRKLAAKLKPRNYARAYVLTRLFKDALVPWMADIPDRHGWRGESRFGLINKMRLNRHQPKNVHEARFFASLAYPVGEEFKLLWPKLKCNPKLQDRVCSAHQIARNRSQVVLAVGARHHDIGKLWGVANYASLASNLSKDGYHIILCGSKNDTTIANKVQELLHPELVTNLTGILSLEETAAVISMSTMVVSNDSGLMHLGAALGLNTLGIFGPTDPGRYHPLGDNADWLAPTKPGAIEQIKLEAVLAKARKMLSNTPPLPLN